MIYSAIKPIKNETKSINHNRLMGHITQESYKPKHQSVIMLQGWIFLQKQRKTKSYRLCESSTSKMSRSSLCLAADFAWDLAHFGLDLADFGRGESRASTDFRMCVLITSTSQKVIKINLLKQHGITNSLTITGYCNIWSVKSLISK